MATADDGVYWIEVEGASEAELRRGLTAARAVLDEEGTPIRSAASICRSPSSRPRRFNLAPQGVSLGAATEGFGSLARTGTPGSNMAMRPQRPSDFRNWMSAGVSARARHVGFAPLAVAPTSRGAFRKWTFGDGRPLCPRPPQAEVAPKSMLLKAVLPAPPCPPSVAGVMCGNRQLLG
jgi:hypothetical protein